MNHIHPHDASGAKKFWGSRHSIGLMVFGVVAAYLLLSEHRAHLVGALPLLLVFSCLGMHVFMHHGHGTRDGGHPPADGAARDTNVPAAHRQAKTDGET